VIRCSECGLANSDQARYCSGCGKALNEPGRCPSCGFENPVGSRFCSQCGQQITGAVPVSIAEVRGPSTQPDVLDRRPPLDEDSWLEAENLMSAMAEPLPPSGPAAAGPRSRTPADWLALAGGLVASGLAMSASVAGERSGPDWPVNPLVEQPLDFDAAGAVFRKQCGLAAAPQKLAKGRLPWAI
jgi:hypothetical protein